MQSGFPKLVHAPTCICCYTFNQIKDPEALQRVTKQLDVKSHKEDLLKQATKSLRYRFKAGVKKLKCCRC